MSLATGTRLGSYEIAGHLGSGGMGEVYRARDTKLGREVAIKVLPDDLQHDAQRLARFEREARLLAALNHGNVATLYGFESHDGAGFLVMELIEGARGFYRIDVTRDHAATSAPAPPGSRRR